uniref:FHA domain-containing protein DDL n=1 Tax=Erigeron canadensis TaxID=72917 RepID=UPI001CB972E6|nr:FHA domain-containing protein DDL [Erigeron canadensis]
MGDRSKSPFRIQRPSRRSPSRRERSPARHRSSHSTKSPLREKPPGRTKSPRRPKSPVTRSPVREKPSSQNQSSKHTRSRSPSDRVPLREPPSKSVVSRSPSPRSKRLRRDRSDHKGDKSSERGNDKNHEKARSPVRRVSRSPESRSPSPRTKRLRRAQADKADKPSDRATRKERDLEIERRDRKPGRDAYDNKSRHGEHHRTRHRSHSPSRDEGNNLREGDHRNGDDDSVAQMKAAAEALETKQKEKPSFELSGKLAAETNRVKGVTLLFTEPPEARKPDIRWRLYVFKGGEMLNEPLYVHRQTCYLFGRERRVADIPTDHPSCSKQHAVLQYRQVEFEQPDGMLAKEVRPYIMDLGSTNGTFINDNRIEPERYHELMEKDTLKFGNSSREYVMLHENSAG